MFKIIPVVLSLALTVGAAFVTDNAINKADVDLQLAPVSTFKEENAVEFSSSATFSQDGFVSIAH